MVFIHNVTLEEPNNFASRPDNIELAIRIHDHIATLNIENASTGIRVA